MRKAGAAAILWERSLFAASGITPSSGMWHQRSVCAVFLTSLLMFLGFPSGFAKGFESVPDLEKAMYLNIDGYPCVRLLNTSGEIGCSNPGPSKVSAPIVRWKREDSRVSQPSTFLVAEDDMQSFFLRVSSVQGFAEKVAAVLVESNSVFSSSEFSPDGKFPQSEFAPYEVRDYEWNPSGSSIMWNRYNFPVFLMSKNSTLTLQKIGSEHKGNRAGSIDVAEFDMVMQTTKEGTHNSESCLRERTCLPLGGYSVWSSLPPVNTTSAESSTPVILVMASQDSASFFRDKSIGAESALSGMISLLAAVDALSRADGLSDLRKQLVFVVFTGEAWGYLGSRRFLIELDKSAHATRGLNSSLIDRILEIGSVGKGTSDGVTTLFAHPGGDTAGSNEILTALQQASESLGSKYIEVKGSSSSNPGVPPSSFMSFLNKNSSISGVVLEDFDSAFANKFYHSHVDNPSNVNVSSVEAAANLVARAAYILAHGSSQPSAAMVNSVRVNASLVKELVSCLLSCDPGLSCSLVKRFISPAAGCPNHYVGVFVNEPSESQPLHYVDDTSRFVWNFLADRTAQGYNSRSTCSKGACSAGGVCVGVEADGIGTCVISSTRYVPAYSPRLKYEEGTWRLTAVNEADARGGVDPVWTESYWNTLGVRIYKAESASYDKLVLLGGVALTLLSYLAVVSARAFLIKALKRD